MKKLLTVIILLIGLLAISTALEAAVTIRYYNKDSKSHKMEAKMSGSTKYVTFESSRTASVTIQGSATKVKIETSCGTVEVEDGDKIEIKDGCITVK